MRRKIEKLLQNRSFHTNFPMIQLQNRSICVHLIYIYTEKEEINTTRHLCWCCGWKGQLTALRLVLNDITARAQRHYGSCPMMLRLVTIELQSCDILLSKWHLSRDKCHLLPNKCHLLPNRWHLLNEDFQVHTIRKTSQSVTSTLWGLNLFKRFS